MTRVKAALIHLAASATVVGTILAIVYFVWYPGATFFIAGAISVVYVLVGVDLVLGPSLTLLVFKPGKPGLKFDLTAIAMIQLVALAYGAYTLYVERPYYMVYVVDRFNLVPEGAIDKSKLRFEELREKPFANIILGYARLPDDPAELSRFNESVFFGGEPDLDGRPEYWEPYAAGLDVVRAHIKPLDGFEPATAAEGTEIEAARKRHGEQHERLGYVAVATLGEDMAMLMDRDTAEPLDILRINPW